mmetsp:Transcript_120941/g.342112  ORF Transcript_120941/g.342112 Transcript_120941/m.342112 type:complete len:753 (-) Transcript_120941:402-2660(-)
MLRRIEFLAAATCVIIPCRRLLVTATDGDGADCLDQDHRWAAHGTNCTKMAGLCDDVGFGKLVRTRCPRTCGVCVARSDQPASSKPLPQSAPTPSASQLEANRSQQASESPTLMADDSIFLVQAQNSSSIPSDSEEVVLLNASKLEPGASVWALGTVAANGSSTALGGTHLVAEDRPLLPGLFHEQLAIALNVSLPLPEGAGFSPRNGSDYELVVWSPNASQFPSTNKSNLVSYFPGPAANSSSPDAKSASNPTCSSAPRIMGKPSLVEGGNESFKIGAGLVEGGNDSFRIVPQSHAGVADAWTSADVLSEAGNVTAHPIGAAVGGEVSLVGAVGAAMKNSSWLWGRGDAAEMVFSEQEAFVGDAESRIDEANFVTHLGSASENLTLLDGVGESLENATELLEFVVAPDLAAAVGNASLKLASAPTKLLVEIALNLSSRSVAVDSESAGGDVSDQAPRSQLKGAIFAPGDLTWVADDLDSLDMGSTADGIEGTEANLTYQRRRSASSSTHPLVATILAAGGLTMRKLSASSDELEVLTLQHKGVLVADRPIIDLGDNATDSEQEEVDNSAHEKERGMPQTTPVDKEDGDCPKGYEQVFGHVYGGDQWVGYNSVAESLEQCADKCTRTPGCGSFEYHRAKHRCYRHTQTRPTHDRNREGFTFCRRTPCPSFKTEVDCLGPNVPRDVYTSEVTMRPGNYCMWSGGACQAPMACSHEDCFLPDGGLPGMELPPQYTLWITRAGLQSTMAPITQLR